MARKAVYVWLFSSLTSIALIHLIEAATVLFFNNQTRLLQLYPFIGEKLQSITQIAYFWASAAATLILWGITCTIAFENPVEAFLNKILSDAKKQSAVETQMLENKGEVLDMMCETLESNNETLAHVRDMVYNVRTEVKDIQPLKDNIEKIRAEIGCLKKEFKKLEENMKSPLKCPTCAKPLLPDFNICPYCGENIKLPEKIVALKEYR